MQATFLLRTAPVEVKEWKTQYQLANNSKARLSRASSLKRRISWTISIFFTFITHLEKFFPYNLLEDITVFENSNRPIKMTTVKNTENRWKFQTSDPFYSVLGRKWQPGPITDQTSILSLQENARFLPNPAESLNKFCILSFAVSNVGKKVQVYFSSLYKDLIETEF